MYGLEIKIVKSKHFEIRPLNNRFICYHGYMAISAKQGQVTFKKKKKSWKKYNNNIYMYMNACIMNIPVHQIKQ